MVDVRLLYPAEKTEAAVRLAESVQAAGYTVERKALADPQGFPDLTAQGRDAGVLLLIWSRSLVSAAMAGEGLGEARRRPNLIEVSVDGIEPAVGGEVSPVVLLSGWRGQPFHLGWQRILADIKRLCGPRDGAGKTARQAPAAAPGPAGADRPSKPSRPAVRAALAAGALIAATLGAAAVLDRGAPDASPPAAARSALAGMSSSPGPMSAPRQQASPAAVETVAEASPEPSFAAAAAPAATTPAASTSEPRPSADPPVRRTAAAAKSSASKRLASASAREVKRYSRKHSKTMRLFCQRSGRSTPQCRSFARSMRALRG
ncbi:MAG TPA: hypothetical protein VF605_04655 [Allosphingosinicella sp.]|jgi:hypothetical protein